MRIWNALSPNERAAIIGIPGTIIAGVIIFYCTVGRQPQRPAGMDSAHESQPSPQGWRTQVPPPTAEYTPTELATAFPTSSTTKVAGPSPVTFAEVLRVEADGSLTDLQKDEFRRKHQGKTVEWAVRVLSVKRQWETQEDSDFSVAFTLPDAKRNFEAIGIATFPSRLRDDMVDLHEGNIIRIRGTLRFLEIGRTVSLERCELLERGN